MNINPTKTRKQLLLQQKPLTSCYVDKIRNSSGWLADQILIYPNRLKKKCSFESERDQKLKEKFQKIKEAKQAENDDPNFLDFDAPYDKVVDPQKEMKKGLE